MWEILSTFYLSLLGTQATRTRSGSRKEGIMASNDRDELESERARAAALESERDQQAHLIEQLKANLAAANEARDRQAQELTAVLEDQDRQTRQLEGLEVENGDLRQALEEEKMRSELTKLRALEEQR